MLPIEAVKKLVPKAQRVLITQEFLDRLEAGVGNSVIADQIKENFLTYLGVLSTGKFKIEDYISAVKFISHKLMGKSNIDAYVATFPERYQRLRDEGQEQIDSFVSAYSKNKLVMRIYEQTIVPSHVLNAPLHQEALNELARMIKTLPDGQNKIKACEAILNYTKAPDVIKGELTIGLDQQETITELRNVTEELAEMYKGMLEKGHKSLKQIAEARIIEVNTVEEDE
jgi:hypothetical protein